MQWKRLIGHQVQRQWFAKALAARRLASTFLFVGPEGIGKRTFARGLAQCWLCRQAAENVLDPCGSCEDCVQVDASTHPDLIEISKPADKAFLPLELLIGDAEQRMREGLCYDISLKPYGGRRKVAIIDDADSLNAEGANALLKTLEEPPTNSVLILVGTSLQRLLPTIRSRCQTVLFQALKSDELNDLILREELADETNVASQLAQTSRGSIVSARMLSDPNLRQQQTGLISYLANRPLAIQELVKSCGSAVDSAGKEARLKRQRLKLLLGTAADFYRAIALARQSPSQVEFQRLVSDDHLMTVVNRILPNWSGGTASAIDCWQLCLEAVENVDRNANQATLLEWWGTELAVRSAS
jgi:DNA polymerase III subunit delta'